MPPTPLEVVVLDQRPLLDLRISQVDATVQATARSWSHDGAALDVGVIAADLADERYGAVCIGPDVPLELCLDVSRHLDLHHPEVGVVLVRKSSTELWRDAARSGIRDIVEPEAIDSDLIPALLAAAERGAESGRCRAPRRSRRAA